MSYLEVDPGTESEVVDDTGVDVIEYLPETDTGGGGDPE
jgi:hypothetical protein